MRIGEYVDNTIQISIVTVMRYDKLVELLGKHGWFDLASLVQLSGERRQSLHMQLHRWCKAGLLLSLRRGLYAFPDRYSASPIHAAEVANILYTPSYLSTHWALGYYGLIPEYVVRYTGVTSRTTKTFENAFGTFSYQHVKPSAFFGYRPVEIDKRKVLLAEPEKALLDLWHLGPGRWETNRMAEMRFQGFELIDPGKLRGYASRFESPRLRAAAETFLKVAEFEMEGVVQL